MCTYRVHKEQIRVAQSRGIVLSHDSETFCNKVADAGEQPADMSRGISALTLAKRR